MDLEREIDGWPGFRVYIPRCAEAATDGGWGSRTVQLVGGHGAHGGAG